MATFNAPTSPILKTSFNSQQASTPNPFMSPQTSKFPSTPQTGIAQMTTVTVFGFPPQVQNKIFNEFKEYGTVLNCNSKPGRNFFTVTYASPDSVLRALSRNASVVENGNYMIGVVPVTGNSNINSPDLLASSRSVRFASTEPKSQRIEAVYPAPVATNRNETPQRIPFAPVTRSPKIDAPLDGVGAVAPAGIWTRLLEGVFGW